MFHHKKSVNYLINAYAKITSTKNEGNVTYQISIDKNSDGVIRSDKYTEKPVDNVDISITGAIYYEHGDILRTQANLTHEFNVLKGNTSIENVAREIGFKYL